MQMSSVLVFLGAIVVSRLISERAYLKLDADEKLRLVDGFSTARAFAMIPLFVLIAAFWFLSAQPEVNQHYLTVGYFALLILYLVVRSFLNQRKLSELELPSSYRRAYTAAQIVSFLGIAWFFFALFCN